MICYIICFKVQQKLESTLIYAKRAFYGVSVTLKPAKLIEWEIKGKRKRRRSRSRGEERERGKWRKKKYFLRSHINIVEKSTYQTCFTTKVQRCFDIQNFVKTFMALRPKHKTFLNWYKLLIGFTHILKIKQKTVRHTRKCLNHRIMKINKYLQPLVGTIK